MDVSQCTEVTCGSRPGGKPTGLGSGGVGAATGATRGTCAYPPAACGPQHESPIALLQHCQTAASLALGVVSVWPLIAHFAVEQPQWLNTDLAPLLRQLDIRLGKVLCISWLGGCLHISFTVSAAQAQRHKHRSPACSKPMLHVDEHSKGVALSPAVQRQGREAAPWPQMLRPAADTKLRAAGVADVAA